MKPCIHQNPAVETVAVTEFTVPTAFGATSVTTLPSPSYTYQLVFHLVVVSYSAKIPVVV